MRDSDTAVRGQKYRHQADVKDVPIVNYLLAVHNISDLFEEYTTKYRLHLMSISANVDIKSDADAREKKFNYDDDIITGIKVRSIKCKKNDVTNIMTSAFSNPEVECKVHKSICYRPSLSALSDSTQFSNDLTLS